ncbi:MAG: 3-hydroxyacyl-CoA dehydrogenase NAD-binding domain-containing protein [Candidatus Hermodarchaeota archaeon]
MSDISKIKTFVVIGAGVMGREIAQVALMAGFEKVILNDINHETLENAVIYIENGLKKIELKDKLNHGFTTDLLMSKLIKELDLHKAVRNADFIVEAIPEKMDLKQELFKKLEELSPEHAVLATNTSTMSISKIAESCIRPDKVVGMHYFIPIPILRLIEVIKGEKTSEETMEIAISVGLKLPCLKGKRFIARIEKESPGFIVNRLTIASSAYFNWLLDEAMKKGIPWESLDADVKDLQELGPCARLDYLGLDTIYNTLKYFEEVLSPDFAPSKALSKLVNEGNLGRKTGRGFYEWTNDGKPIINKAEKANLIDLDLFMAVQLNEGCRLIEEGVVSGYKIIDDTMLAGMSMPGPFGAGKRNYEKWSKLLEDFVKKSGKEYFKPCELMKSGKFLKMRK